MEVENGDYGEGFEGFERESHESCLGSCGVERFLERERESGKFERREKSN